MKKMDCFGGALAENLAKKSPIMEKCEREKQ